MSAQSPSTTEPRVASVGVFDGVHRGHRALLARARSRASERGLRLMAITFDPHPMSVVRPGSEPTSLATIAHRIELLRAAGADEVHVLKFDSALAATEPEDFVRELLAKQLGVREIVVGQNFRFGRRARGTIDTLRSEGAAVGMAVTAVPLVGDGAERWSSTRTRQLIADGDVAGAAQALARPYRIDGLVVHGDHRGRELGFPTANIEWEGSPTVPADGVYAGWITAPLATLPAAISVGTNPQFGGAQRRVEAYALDRDDLDLYGQQLGVSFVERIRGQQVFDTVPALVERMAADVDKARSLLAPDG